MVKNLNLIGNSTASSSVHPPIHPSIHPSIWCRNVLVPNRRGELTSLVPKRLDAPNRQNAVVVVEIHSTTMKESRPSDY